MAGSTLLHGQRSEFQSIELWRDEEGFLELTLDRVWQFHEREEARFHAFLADAPACLAAQLGRVLVLGGGDGLVVRNLLRYPQVGRIDLVELDGAVIDLAREHVDVRALNEDALRDEKVHVVVGDALDFVESSNDGPFDLIVCDFPAPTHPGLEPLFAAPFYARLARRLGRDGVLCVQASCPPEVFWRVHASVRASFAWTRPLIAQLDPRFDARPQVSDAWANFIIASHAARSPRRASQAPSEPFDAQRLDAHTLRIGVGGDFVSAAYGSEPKFDDP